MHGESPGSVPQTPHCPGGSAALAFLERSWGPRAAKPCALNDPCQGLLPRFNYHPGFTSPGAPQNNVTCASWLRAPRPPVSPVNGEGALGRARRQGYLRRLFCLSGAQEAQVCGRHSAAEPAQRRIRGFWKSSKGTELRMSVFPARAPDLLCAQTWAARPAWTSAAVGDLCPPPLVCNRASGRLAPHTHS